MKVTLINNGLRYKHVDFTPVLETLFHAEFLCPELKQPNVILVKESELTDAGIIMRPGHPEPEREWSFVISQYFIRERNHDKATQDTVESSNGIVIETATVSA